MLTGGTDESGSGREGFSMGSMTARLRGPNHPETGLPTFSVLTSPEVDGQYRKELDRVLQGSQPGTLGLVNAPFHHVHNSEADKPGAKSPARTKDQGTVRWRRTCA